MFKNWNLTKSHQFANLNFPATKPNPRRKKTLKNSIFDQISRENSNIVDFLPLKILNFGTKIQIDQNLNVFISLNFLTKKWAFGTLCAFARLPLLWLYYNTRARLQNSENANEKRALGSFFFSTCHWQKLTICSWAFLFYANFRQKLGTITLRLIDFLGPFLQASCRLSLYFLRIHYNTGWPNKFWTVIVQKWSKRGPKLV